LDEQYEASFRAVIRVSNRKLLFGLLLFALSLRIAAACLWQSRLDTDGQFFRFGDSDSYWVIARNLSKGRFEYGGENSKIFRAPLYPLLLAPLAADENDNTAISNPDAKVADSGHSKRRSVFFARLLGCVLGTLCVWGVVKITADICSEEAGLVAGALAAVYPGAIGMSIFILSESIFCPCMIASIYAIQRSSNGLTGVTNHKSKFTETTIAYGVAMIGGIFSGLAILARPSWSLWGGMLAIYCLSLWFLHRRTLTLQTTVFQWLAFALGILVMMAPWWMRNYAITGKFVPTTLQVGASLYDGLHHNATGSSDEGMAFSDVYLAEQLREDELVVASGGSLESTLEWRVDRRLRNAAIQWAFENPSDVVSLSLVKLVKTWRPFPVAKEIGNGAIRYAEGIVYLAIVSFGSMGVWSCRKEMGSWLCVLPCIYFALIHMLFIGSVRYRQPAVLVLCVLAGIGFCWLVRCCRHRNLLTNDAKDGFNTSQT
jgi:hypothetical protein